MKAKHFNLLLAAVFVSGCVSTARRAALFEGDERQRYSVKNHVTDEDLHDSFSRAHMLEIAPIPEADRQEGASLRLHAYLFSVGDHRFAHTLQHEPPNVIRSVAHSMDVERIARGYPKSYALLLPHRRAPLRR